MAEEVKHLFRVAWEDPEDPDKVITVIMEQFHVSFVHCILFTTHMGPAIEFTKNIGK